MRKIRVIMAGPLPPNVGGMATVINDLGKSKLSNQVDLVFFNTAKTTREGRGLLEAVSSKVKLWLDWMRLLKNKCDTVAHIHTCSGFTFFLDGILVFLAKFSSTPVVLHIHGGKFDQFLNDLSPVLIHIVRYIFRVSEFVIVLSPSWKTVLQKRLGELKFRVIANGVPVFESSLKSRNKSSKVNILFLGNLSENKGIFDLLDVMRKIDDAVLHMVGGEDEPGIFARVNELIQAPELISKVTLYGVKLGQEKQQILIDADIFVLPSYAEGLPVSLLEAMACGIPVIASNVGGIPAVVTNEVEGFLITAGNQEQLATALKQLIYNFELREKMGQAGRKVCQSQFSIDATVDKLLHLYWEIFPEFRKLPE